MQCQGIARGLTGGRLIGAMLLLATVVFCDGIQKSALSTLELVSVIPTPESDTIAFRVILELRATDIRCKVQLQKQQNITLEVMNCDTK